MITSATPPIRSLSHQLRCTLNRVPINEQTVGPIAQLGRARNADIVDDMSCINRRTLSQASVVTTFTNLFSQYIFDTFHYHPTLDPAVLWTPSNDTSRPIYSDSLNLTPPAPLYLRTLWHYTNAVIIIIITHVNHSTFNIYAKPIVYKTN